jgi:ligand-binding SRPBCC domain-containing protein
MKVSIATTINLPPEDVWQRVQTPELLLHIAAPLIKFSLIEPATATRFSDGDRFRVGLKLFGILPFGDQWIVPSIHVPTDSEWPKRLRDNGYSALITTWDHWITIKPDGQGKTHYRDEVEVKAGMITPFIWLFAQIFYRHRQRRWRQLARRISKGEAI